MRIWNAAESWAYGVGVCASLAAVVACGGSEDSAERTARHDPVHDDAAPLPIEESDLYKLVDSTLYVYSAHTGLNVIDVSDATNPVLKNRVETVQGEAGELYVRDEYTYVMLEDVVSGCELPPELDSWAITAKSMVTAIADADAIRQAETVAEYCLPGTMVASRLVGDTMIVVTSHAQFGDAATWVFSLDVANPRRMQVLDYVAIDGDGHEVHVTDGSVYVAQRFGDDWEPATRVQHVSLDRESGALVASSSFDVPGAVLSRFHLDEYQNTFRIVTFGDRDDGTYLHVVDVSEPGEPRLIGALEHLAIGEDLHATRFVNDRAYIVTYEPVVVQTDPLWVVSLEDPTAPVVLGELEVPGWSEYVFPRGDRLVAVGRGDRGERIATSLFDVSDPNQPLEIDRLEFRNFDSSSEANVDFRGVTILDEALGDPALVAVPYTDNVWTEDGCVPQHGVQLIDLADDDLTLRGSFAQQGRVRRTLAIGERLFTVTDREVATVDVTQRSTPVVTSTLEVGDPEAPNECVWSDVVVDDEWDDWVGCSAAPRGARPGNWSSVGLVLMGLGLGWRRRRRAGRNGHAPARSTCASRSYP
jgi:hypothetical protein